MKLAFTPQERVGTVIGGKYELSDVLGIGTTGVVYRAKHRFTDRRVAVKILHAHRLGNAEAVQRFMREAKAASSVGHSAIVSVFDAGETEDAHPYLVQELLEGRTLEAALLEHLVTIPQLIAIAAELLDGLAAVHAVGIVHRDVCPRNVFLVPREDGGYTVKLVDFGTAKLLGPRASALTLPGQALGSPTFMSPEQALGQTIDARSDLFGVGATLFFGVMGHGPFGKPSDGAGNLLERLATTRAPKLAELRPDLPRSLTEAVDRALEPQPAARFPSADAMAEALRRSDATVSGLDWDEDS